MKVVLFLAGVFALFGAASSRIWIEALEYFQLASILIAGAVITDEISKLRRDLSAPTKQSGESFSVKKFGRDILSGG
jgi:hypothetical protein